MARLWRGVPALLLAVVAAGCAGPVTVTDVRNQAAEVVTVHRSPTCGCCQEYEDYLVEHGFEVRVEEHDDMAAVKDAMGVPDGLWSCHTSEIGGYLAEGHVPVEALRDLLAQQPDVDGIALPAMPAGSPGMAGVKEAPFLVESFTDGAPTGTFGSY